MIKPCVGDILKLKKNFSFSDTYTSLLPLTCYSIYDSCHGSLDSPPAQSKFLMLNISFYPK